MMKKNKVGISLTVITYNEEENIKDLIINVDDIVDEIIVVDSYSEDNTVKIAKANGAKVFKKKWIDFATQKQFALEKATQNYVLTLDADERLSEELKKNILRIKNNISNSDGYLIKRKAFYMGRWIKHSGWYPDLKVRLFRKDKSNWEGDFVHERLVLSGKKEKLKGDVLHYPYEDLSEHIGKINRYAYLSAKKLKQKGKNFNFLKLSLSPIFRFFRHYVLKLGFLDGFQGFIIAVLSSYYVFLKYLYLWERDKN